MKLNPSLLWAALLAAALADAATLTLRASPPRAVLPDAVVDLRTTAGVARVKAEWRYSDTTIREIEHRDAGADLKASGRKNHAFDFSPDARAADFDDSHWEVLPADSLEGRRGHGRHHLGRGGRRIGLADRGDRSGVRQIPRRRRFRRVLGVVEPER